MVASLAGKVNIGSSKSSEIKNREVVKGMNKQECLLAFGKPASVQKQGNKEEWMYDSYTYVFFENETVASLIK